MSGSDLPYEFEEEPEELTPCDNPYPDCQVCNGTGKPKDADYPCPSCVWRRWFAENVDMNATLEELARARAESE